MTSLPRVFVATTTLALLAAPLPALAHATLEVASAPANSTFKAVLRLPHGCEGEATHTLTVTMPEGFIAVKPMPKAGWTLATTKGDYEKSYKLWGDTVSSGVTEVTWSGGNLPDEFYDEFVFQGRVTDLAPGTVLPFKAVQTCANGEVAWTDVAAEGQDAHDLPHPAPTLRVAEAGGQGHGHAGHAAAAQPADGIAVATPWMRQPPPGADVAGGYMVITNPGATADRLVGGSAAFAERVEVHQMAMANGMMTMEEVEGGLEVPAGGEVKLQPGGLHVMFFGLRDVPQAGDSVPVTLTFEKAGEVTVDMSVEAMGASQPAEAHHKH